MRPVLALAVLLCAAGGWPVTQAPEAVEFTGYDVVIMGEVHDNPGHHVNQAKWIARLAPTAVVYEMLTPDLADVATRQGGDAPDLGQALKWDQSGWPDFRLYAPVFAAAPQAAIWGGDVPREQITNAIRQGAASAMGDAASIFGLDIPLPRLEQETRESMMADSHCGALPTEMLPGMVEAQRLRDAALAEAVFGALLTHGAPVAVITGNGHARTDWGLPSALKMAMPNVAVLSIGQLETVPTTAQPFDVLTLSEAPDRGDPCNAFR